VIIGFGKTNWIHSTHRDYKSDLSIGCLDIGYSVQGYIGRAF
jgi:hypothetical protein